MSIALGQVLPVLRTPAHARQDATTFHFEIPGERVGATPWAAFTTGQGLLSRADVASSGVSGKELFDKARANLLARAPKWTVETRTGGFLGIGKKTVLITYTDPFAAEQIMNDTFMKEAQLFITPNSFDRSRVAFFVPKRGRVSAVLVSGKDNAQTPFYKNEMEQAKTTWSAAGSDAVCPAELGPYSTVGNTFTIRRRFDGKDDAYLPPRENVRLMVMRKNVFSYVANGATAQKREFIGDLSLCLGVRDENGQQTPLTESMLNELGLAFETAINDMIAGIPALPVIEMGALRTGQPVIGFRGNGAIDQLASVQSLARLHAKLGDPFELHVYSHVRVAATTPGALQTGSNLFDMIELCDPRPPNVIMTRGAPDLECYTVSNGKVTDVSKIKL